MDKGRGEGEHGWFYRHANKSWKFIWKLVALQLDEKKKADTMRYCACCKGPAYYVFTTAPQLYKGDLPPPDSMLVYVCSEHHPNPLRGIKAEETKLYLFSINPTITHDLINVNIPF